MKIQYTNNEEEKTKNQMNNLPLTGSVKNPCIPRNNCKIYDDGISCRNNQLIRKNKFGDDVCCKDSQLDKQHLTCFKGNVDSKQNAHICNTVNYVNGNMQSNRYDAASYHCKKDTNMNYNACINLNKNVYNHINNTHINNGNNVKKENEGVYSTDKANTNYVCPIISTDKTGGKESTLTDFKKTINSDLCKTTNILKNSAARKNEQIKQNLSLIGFVGDTYPPLSYRFSVASSFSSLQAPPVPLIKPQSSFSSCSSSSSSSCFPSSSSFYSSCFSSSSLSLSSPPLLLPPPLSNSSQSSSVPISLRDTQLTKAHKSAAIKEDESAKEEKITTVERNKKLTHKPWNTCHNNCNDMRLKNVHTSSCSVHISPPVSTIKQQNKKKEIYVGNQGVQMKENEEEKKIEQKYEGKEIENKKENKALNPQEMTRNMKLEEAKEKNNKQIVKLKTSNLIDNHNYSGNDGPNRFVNRHEDSLKNQEKVKTLNEMTQQKEEVKEGQKDKSILDLNKMKEFQKKVMNIFFTQQTNKSCSPQKKEMKKKCENEENENSETEKTTVCNDINIQNINCKDAQNEGSDMHNQIEQIEQCNDTMNHTTACNSTTKKDDNKHENKKQNVCINFIKGKQKKSSFALSDEASIGYDYSLDFYKSNRHTTYANQDEDDNPCRMSSGCFKLIDNIYFAILNFVLTVISILGKDIFYMFFCNKDDIVLDVLLIICSIYFVMEMIILVFCGKKQFVFGFFCWVDFVSILSIPFDLSPFSYIFFKNSFNIDYITWMEKVTIVHVVLGRVFRMFRLIRLIRIVMLLKNYIVLFLKNNKGSNCFLNVFHRLLVHKEYEEDHFECLSNKSKQLTLSGETVYTESRVGQRLTELTTRKFIIVLLLLLFVFPFFLTGTTSREFVSSAKYAIDTLDWIYEGTTKEYETSVLSFLYYHKTYVSQEVGEKLIYIKLPKKLSEVSMQKKINDTQLWNFEGLISYEKLLKLTHDEVVLKGVLLDDHINTLNDLRVIEKLYISSQKKKHFAVFDRRYFTVKDSYLAILQTLFVIFILLIHTLLFYLDSKALVMKPIRIMMDRINIIRGNPLAAIRLQEEIARREIKKQKRKETADVALPFFPNFLNTFAKKTYAALTKALGIQKKVEGVPLETIVLEQVILKLGALIALGFGEAGASIIADSLSFSSSSPFCFSPNLINPKYCGKKVFAIFAFCDIRNFTQTTEALQENVMTFVNTIAFIVHDVVDFYWGWPNKNIGDAFLLIWKFPLRHPYTNELLYYNNHNHMHHSNDYDISHLYDNSSYQNDNNNNYNTSSSNCCNLQQNGNNKEYCDGDTSTYNTEGCYSNNNNYDYYASKNLSYSVDESDFEDSRSRHYSEEGEEKEEKEVEEDFPLNNKCNNSLQIGIPMLSYPLSNQNDRYNQKLEESTKDNLNNYNLNNCYTRSCNAHNSSDGMTTQHENSCSQIHKNHYCDINCKGRNIMNADRYNSFYSEKQNGKENFNYAEENDEDDNSKFYECNTQICTCYDPNNFYLFNSNQSTNYNNDNDTINYDDSFNKCKFNTISLEHNNHHNILHDSCSAHMDHMSNQSTYNYTTYMDDSISHPPHTYNNHRSKQKNEEIFQHNSYSFTKNNYNKKHKNECDDDAMNNTNKCKRNSAEISDRLLKKKKEEEKKAINKTADMALMSFIQVIKKLKKCVALKKYKEKVAEALERSCASEHMSNEEYSTTTTNRRNCIINFEREISELGFGIHYGWAIEGAIGSEYKIDASYLSFNVNIASRLESATKLFRTPILFSGEFANLLSTQFKREIRQVDRVILKGAGCPTDLFTFDINPNLLDVNECENLKEEIGDPGGPFFTNYDASKMRFQMKRSRRARKKSLWNPKVQISSFIYKDPGIRAMRRCIEPSFLQQYAEAFKLYSDGEWQKSKVILQRIRYDLGDPDGPTEALLDFMKTYNFQPPKDWKGYRTLDAK